MSHRVYADDTLTSDTIELEEQEARHLRDVMRIKVGETVEVFNGKGVVATAVVSKAAKRCVELQLQSRRTVERILTGITIAAAIPKGDRFKWMIEKLTELNVDRFIPLQTRRSVVSPGGAKFGKMQHAIIAAAKQCRRDDLMEIAPIMKWDDAVTQFGSNMLLADPDGHLAMSMICEQQTTVFAVGPEGGFSPEETQLAIDAGAKPVCFGNTILRIETAAVAAAAIGVFLSSSDLKS